MRASASFVRILLFWYADYFILSPLLRFKPRPWSSGVAGAWLREPTVGPMLSCWATQQWGCRCRRRCRVAAAAYCILHAHRVVYIKKASLILIWTNWSKIKVCDNYLINLFSVKYAIFKQAFVKYSLWPNIWYALSKSSNLSSSFRCCWHHWHHAVHVGMLEATKLTLAHTHTFLAIFKSRCEQSCSARAECNTKKPRGKCFHLQLQMGCKANASFRCPKWWRLSWHCKLPMLPFGVAQFKRISTRTVR